MKKRISLIACVFYSAGLFADQGMGNPPPAPPAAETKSFNTFTYVEFLYWKFSSPALVFGRDGIGLTNAASPAEINVDKTGTSYSPHFKFSPGYRAAFGFFFGPSKAFDWVLRYTWFYTNPKRTVSDFSASFLPVSWLVNNALASSTYHKASFAMNLHYHYPETQLGYTFKVNPYLSLRPYMAISGVIIDADMKAHYEFTHPGTPAFFETATTHGDCFSWAIGPKIGLDFTARPIRNFSVYCGVNFTQLASQLSLHATQEDHDHGGETKVQKGQLSEVRSVPLFGFEMGPVWDQWFYNDKYHFQLRAVWQASTLGTGNLSFLNNNNVEVPVAAELRGINIRAFFEF